MSKKKYLPKSFESIGGQTLSANLYASMLQSKAYKSLSNGARTLYTFMKLQYYGAKGIKDHDKTDFYFNWALANKTYSLYTNNTQFKKDRDMLVEYGFIEVVENGKSSRTKNIYRFSDKWKII